MKKIVFILFLFFSVNCFGQNSDAYKIVFYNVENLFDTFDDSLKNDNEFLPEGDKFWNNSKYYDKINRIYKVITAIGEWNPPAIIGLCEIENKKVLNDIVNNTPLVKYEYEIIHKDSPDQRGIDVGLLYRKELFTPLSYDFVTINFPDNPDLKTRDILYAKGIANKVDTIHVFINHWPSRWGGQLESEPKRTYVASVLKEKVDSLFAINENANIIITGDFNDYPENKSLNIVLNAKHDFSSINQNSLYNLSSLLQNKPGLGTHKYKGKWSILDQFIISGNLLNDENELYTTKNDVYIFNKDFLLEPDANNFGFKPFRTYIGFKYNNGYSDHLPTYLILHFNK